MASSTRSHIHTTAHSQIPVLRAPQHAVLLVLPHLSNRHPPVKLRKKAVGTVVVGVIGKLTGGKRRGAGAQVGGLCGISLAAGLASTPTGLLAHRSSRVRQGKQA